MIEYAKNLGVLHLNLRFNTWAPYFRPILVRIGDHVLKLKLSSKNLNFSASQFNLNGFENALKFEFLAYAFTCFHIYLFQRLFALKFDILPHLCWTRNPNLLSKSVCRREDLSCVGIMQETEILVWHVITNPSKYFLPT